MKESPDALLEEWAKHADAVESNIVLRDNRKFRLAYRKAEQCSRKIQFLMRHGHTQPFLEQKERVTQLIQRWDDIAEQQIKPWMDEVKDKIDQLRTRKKKGNKINKAYGFAPKSIGQSLRMKAR